MRILVLGGTVFLSRAVAEEAVARGHEVVCACRGSAPLPDGVSHVPLDRAGTDVAGVLAGAGVFDTVVEPGRMPSWVEAAVRARPDAHWVYVSSISVYPDGHRADEPDRLREPIWSDEDLRTNPDAYGGMKVACERAVLDRARSATVLRPGLIVGPGDPTGRFTYWPARLAEPGPVLAPGRPGAPVQVVDVRDLAALVVTCAERRPPTVADAVGPVLDWGGLLAEVARGVVREPELVWVDDASLQALGVEPWAGPNSLPVWIPEGAEGDLLAHAPDAAMELGLRPRPLAETARDTLAWFRATPTAVTTGISRDREAALLAEVTGTDGPDGPG